MITAFGYTTIELTVLLFAGGSAVIGLIIAFLAYRGLRRNESTQMLFLSTGMILLFGIAYGISIIGTVLLQLRILSLPYQDPFRLAVRVTQFAGLLCIAYSMYLGRRFRKERA